MVTPIEKQSVLHEMLREPVWAAGVVYKCAAGLLILIGVASSGGQADLQGAVPDARTERASKRQTLSTAVAESKAVFDERRWRFEARVMRPSEVAER